MTSVSVANGNSDSLPALQTCGLGSGIPHGLRWVALDSLLINARGTCLIVTAIRIRLARKATIADATSTAATMMTRTEENAKTTVAHLTL